VLFRSGRGLVEIIDHPGEGEIPQIVNPLALSGLARKRRSPAPEVGESSDIILNGLGFDAKTIEQFHKNRVI